MTFSRPEDTLDCEAMQVINRGVNVAAVFSPWRTSPLPDNHLGVTVFDGDKDDLRFLDPVGVWVGLRAKGKARRDTSEFVIQV